MSAGHFRHGYWSTQDDTAWCPTCLLPSAVKVERRMGLVDQDGASSLPIGEALYCFEHEDFVSPLERSIPVEPIR